jgi:hypothetical protein
MATHWQTPNNVHETRLKRRNNAITPVQQEDIVNLDGFVAHQL